MLLVQVLEIAPMAFPTVGKHYITGIHPQILGFFFVVVLFCFVLFCFVLFFLRQNLTVHPKLDLNS